MSVITLTTDFGVKDHYSGSVKGALFKEVSRYPGQEQQIMELYQKNPEAMASIRAPIFEDKIVDFITEMATVTEKTVSPEQLMSPPEEVLDQPSEKSKKKPAKKAKPKKKAAEAKKDKK